MQNLGHGRLRTAVTPGTARFKLSDVKTKKGIKKLANQFLDCKQCGLEDKFVLHAWTWFILFDSLSKYILFNTNFFGHYTTRRGLLSIYSVVYMSIAIAFVYAWYLLDKNDSAFKLVWLVRFHTFTFGAAFICYAFDGIIFIIDERMFCTLQAENSKTCEERNEYFLQYVVFFYIFWVPVWFSVITSMTRYMRNQLSTTGEVIQEGKIEIGV